MSAAAEQHHHRSTTQSQQKPFKSRFASKSALKDKAKGKVERFQTGPRRTPHQQVMSKFDRKNQAKQKRIAKLYEHGKITNIFAGQDRAPRIVAVVPLTEDIAIDTAIKSLNSCLDIEELVSSRGVTRVSIERFKQDVSYFSVKRELFEAMDACRTADYVLFLLSAKEEVDGLGESMLRCIEGQGVSQVYVAVQGLEAVESAKRKTQVLASLKSFVTHFFPAQEKIFSLDSRPECLNLMRSLCTTTPKGIRWREERSWMMVEDVRWSSNKQNAMNGGDESTGDVILTGVIRGKPLKADRLVQVADWGDFQIDKITSASLERPSKKRKENDLVMENDQIESVLDQPGADQDQLQELAPIEAVMDDLDPDATSAEITERKGVLVDDQNYAIEDNDEDEEMQIPKKLPRGTSNYQSAWFLGDVSDSGSDLEDMEDDEGDTAMYNASIPADGVLERGQGSFLRALAEDAEDTDADMFVDRSLEEEAEELAEYRTNKMKNEAAEDLKFPDEIELHPNELARERLTKYRGLTSLRTSPWSREQDTPYQPDEWNRLLDISNYKGAKSAVTREALAGGVKAGTRVHVYVRGVPNSLQNSYDPSRPFALFSLLRHEHKHTAVNYSITLDSSHPDPIKSKEEILIQAGPRCMLINPLFSTPGNTPNDVHKFERYLHPGRTAVASFTGPLLWGSVPAVFFKRVSPGDTEAMDTTASTASWQLIGHGTCLPASTRRVLVKRAILTGATLHINPRIVTVRYMFFNAEDVAWFAALPLWTNRGRQGVIRESLGTHGYFKAMFDGKINPQETVGVSLYKRMWPRPAKMVTAVGE